ncbi:serine protease [Dyella sp. LX-66]|uniref:PA domain-containing protein n=1 Tax=unclassified Dyella TaxID=2634549 RepID=UPI001BE0CD69|nr:MULTISPECIES: PA domain-containing protein [unclassified Dyella]MBT2117516.1 serine protease [Dyella sp. LX-1]MBT2119361.1 serine protease [Dyella sp. LX-1]MBT2138580.1 serine protease [Dyella sp. LX-66]
MSRRKRWLMVLAGGLMAAAGAAPAEIRIENRDIGTGMGLDDPAAAAPVGGNPGKTRGEQARIVFEYAASLWGSVLKSRPPIIVGASFKKLACAADGGTLGQAGPADVFVFASGAGIRPGVAYHIALAKALSGQDLTPGAVDINAAFNGAIGTPGCLEGSSWYFGLDGNTPRGQNNFLNVVLHEMAHGLGFLGFGDVETGAPATNDDGLPIPDIYSLFAYDNAKGKRWYDMSNAERASSALNDGHLVFTGANVKAHAPLALGTRNALQVTAPAAIAGEYEFTVLELGPAPTPANFSGTVVRAVTGGNAQGCTAFDNAAAVAGHVALIDTGTCDFTTKARFAQAAGATGVVFAYDPAGPAISIQAGAGAAVTIPVLGLLQKEGDVLKANLAGLTVSMRATLAGADLAGYVQLYAPKTVQSGSSFSHFDTRLSPNALMEFALTPDLKGHIDLDLTPSLFMDEGWRLNSGGQLLGTCDTGVPTWVPGGVIVGANIAAQAKMLATTSATAGDYAAGIRAHAATLASIGLLNATQASSLNSCLSDADLARQYASWRQGGNGGTAFTELDSGKAMPALAGATGSERLYLLTVPPGARSLNIRSFGGTGDVSLVVRVGNEPMPTSFSYLSAHPGNSESVVVARPVAGAYFIKLVGIKPYANVSLQATYSM